MSEGGEMYKVDNMHVGTTGRGRLLQGAHAERRQADTQTINPYLAINTSSPSHSYLNHLQVTPSNPTQLYLPQAHI